MTSKTTSVFAQMTRIVEESSHLLIANSQDFWEGDRQKISDANPGLHLWIVSQSGTDFFRLGSFPQQRTLLNVLQNRLQTYSRRHVDFYAIEIVRLNNSFPDHWRRPQGTISLLTYEEAIAYIEQAFQSQKISA